MFILSHNRVDTVNYTACSLVRNLQEWESKMSKLGWEGQRVGVYSQSDLLMDIVPLEFFMCC